LPSRSAKSTDALDAVGNTTKAVTKGYAIGSAGLAALVLFAAYTHRPATDVLPRASQVDFSLDNPDVDRRPAARRACCPTCSARMAHDGGGPRRAATWSRKCAASSAKSRASWTARRSRTTAAPSTSLTKAAIKEMIIPSLLPVLAPIVLYFVIACVAGQANGFAALGAPAARRDRHRPVRRDLDDLGGGAWDNAKKYIEDGHHGGKGSEAHKAAVTGDTVGDPYKDTAGPAVNPMIKITNIVALLLLAALAGGH